MTDTDMFFQFVRASLSGHRRELDSDYCAVDYSNLDCSACPASLACDKICDAKNRWEDNYLDFIIPQIEKYGTDLVTLQNDYPEYFI